MKQELSVKQQKQSLQINRLGYVLFLILVAYLLVKGDLEWAIVNFGIALIFDPFDFSVQWKDRPRYQKAWLLMHVALSMAGFICLMLR